MVKSKTTTSVKSKKSSAKATKAPVKKTITKKSVAKKPRANSAHKVDYYPNRMTVAISALAGTMITLLAIIAVLSSK